MADPVFHVVIPSRYAATRLPGKPLRLIAGKTMIEHVYRRAAASGAASVCVATDDERIVAEVERFGGRAQQTRPDHPSGTDRVFEVAERDGLPDDAIVVNLQGDEPCMDPQAVQRTASLVGLDGIATLATPIRSPAELFASSVVKVVVDDAGLARWFSRAPIPWVRGVFDDGIPDSLPAGVPFLRHLGIYGYRVGALRRLCRAPAHPHEQAECLEQLRALALGIPIHVGVVDEAPGHGVDTEDDLRRVEALLAQRSSA